jgi:hypothetical protein
MAGDSPYERLLAEVGRAFVEQASVLARARRERDSLARRLARRFAAQMQATRLLGMAVHLRAHGEQAGGEVTWAEFDRLAGEFLGFQENVPETTGVLFGRDAGVEWLHEGPCSWPERPCTGHMTSYSPVRVPENTGKHPAESGETGET